MNQHPRTDALAREMYLETLKSMGPFLPFIGYLVGLIVGVDDQNLAKALLIAALVFVVFVVALPFIDSRRIAREALAEKAGEEPGVRLSRLVEAPRKMELALGNATSLGAAAYAVAAALVLHASFWVVPAAFIVVAGVNTLIGMRLRLVTEQLVMPEALAEFHRHPTANVKVPWMLAGRQSWYLPYAMASVLIATLSTLGAIIVVKVKAELAHEAAALAQPGGATASSLEERATSLVHETAVPLVLFTVLILLASMNAAFLLARRNARANQQLFQTVTSLANGAPRLPEWISGDEIGELAQGIAKALEQLREMAVSLGRSATDLASSANALGSASGEQNDTLTRQAAALQETQTTAQEIRQTSVLAAQKTSNILALVEKADVVGASGEAALNKTVDSLADIRGQVEQIAQQVASLGERARQVVNITQTVKDLADQSNMLALNAAIEAVRSGEHGKGFAVVAREIRTLADQSLQATARVRSQLEDITVAIGQAVQTSASGLQKIQASLGQVRTSGESLRELSAIVRENADGVRQVAAAVSQQNAGIGQIFEAVKELSTMMDDTLRLVGRSQEAAAVVRRVADDVGEVVKRHGGQAA